MINFQWNLRILSTFVFINSGERKQFIYKRGFLELLWAQKFLFNTDGCKQEKMHVKLFSLTKRTFSSRTTSIALVLFSVAEKFTWKVLLSPRKNTKSPMKYAKMKKKKINKSSSTFSLLDCFFFGKKKSCKRN